MGANEAISAIGTGDKSQRTEQVYDKDYYFMQYAENQQQTRRPNSIWVEGGAFIT